MKNSENALNPSPTKTTQESVNEEQPLLQQKQEMPFDNSAAEAIELLEDMTQLEKLFKGIIIVGVLLFIV